MAHPTADPERVRETCTVFLAYAVGACGGDPSRLPQHRDELEQLFARFKQVHPAAPSGQPWCSLATCLFLFAREWKVLRFRKSKLLWAVGAVSASLSPSMLPAQRQHPAGGGMSTPPHSGRAPRRARAPPAQQAGGLGGPAGQAPGGVPPRRPRRGGRRARLVRDKGGIEVQPASFFPPQPATAEGATGMEASGGGANGTEGGAAPDAGVATSAGRRRAAAGERLTQAVAIVNKSGVWRALEGVRLERRIRGATITFPGCEGISRDAPRQLFPGEVLELTVSCHLAAAGALRAMVLFEFHGFTVGRLVALDVDDDVSVMLRLSAPYVRKRRLVHDFRAANFLVGGRPDMGRTPVPKGPPLPQGAIPGHVRALKPDEAEAMLVDMPRTPDTYLRRMALLLHLEELQMLVDIRGYDLYSAEMRKDGDCLRLRVLGLAEKRPSILRGDALMAKEAGGGDDTLYKGFVHDVMLEEVRLKFHKSLHDRWFQGKKYNIQFSFNRTTLRRMHQAIQLAQFLAPTLLFAPLRGHMPLSPHPTPWAVPGAVMTDGHPPLKLRNDKLNDEQQEAVCKILALDAVTNEEHHKSPRAFILFGPPGTGKTTTIVEAILQVLRRAKSSHGTSSGKILVCAPSNGACDLLLQKLQRYGVTPLDALRINAMQRAFRDVPADLLPFCERFYDKGARVWEAPTLDDIARARLVVATCSSCALLHVAGASAPGLFSHVFLDEAGHAMEPEALIPITCALRRNDPDDYYARNGAFLAPDSTPRAGMLVLAGDPRQLGPVIRSSLASSQGLGTSLLEWLMPDVGAPQVDRAPGPLSGSHMTMLVRNYRSHPAILDMPSRLFYDGRLQPYADKALRESLCAWKGLPAKGFPVVFHGVNGRCEREGNSPSWFNRDEISAVHKYVLSMLQDRGLGLLASDIGIVTPYRKQVEKLKYALSMAGFPQIKVGSTEEFQGQERKVIIISTVRSNAEHLAEYLEMDARFDLGFVANPKRFNVAITRAQALLLVVGSPHVLALDPHWRQFLAYVLEKGGYTGDVDFGPEDLEGHRLGGDDDDDDDDSGDDGGNGDDVAGRLGALSLTQSADGLVLVTHHDDPAWRDAE